MVTASFFGPPKAAGATKAEEGVAVTDEEKARAQERAVALARTPLQTTFDETAEYEYLDELASRGRRRRSHYCHCCCRCGHCCCCCCCCCKLLLQLLRAVA